MAIKPLVMGIKDRNMDFNDNILLSEINRFVSEKKHEGLTKRKVTDKFIKEHFDIKELKRKTKRMKDVETIPVEKLFYANPLPTEIWVGNIVNMFKNEYVATKRMPDGHITFLSFNKEEFSEKEIIDILKKELKSIIDLETGKSQKKKIESVK